MAACAARPPQPSGRPLPLAGVADLPPQMIAAPHWATYHLGERDGDLAKIPIDAKTGRNAKANDPATWSTFEVAHAYAARHGYGLWFFLAPPFVGIDLDDCRDPETGALTTLARTIVWDVETYWEVSVSGKGLKGIAYGEKPGGRCRRQGLKLELYAERRGFALTGRRLDDAPLAVNDCGAAIAHLYSAAFAAQEAAPRSSRGPQPVTDDDDRAVLDWLDRSMPKFPPLWAGDTSAYGGDESAADLALCNLLAYRIGPDPGRIDRLFRQSGCYRDKWDERRGATTYGERTVGKALDRSTWWQPPRPSPAVVAAAPVVEGDGEVTPAVVVALRARVADLERQVERERQRADEEARQRQKTQAMLTKMLAVRANAAIKAQRDTITAAIVDAAAEIANGRADGEGWVRQPAARIGAAVGKKPETAREHMACGERWGIFDRRRVEYPDPQTGARREVYEVRLRDEPDRLLDVLVTLDPRAVEGELPEERRKKSWGGKREATCPDHPHAARVKRWRTHCTECDRLLDGGDEPLSPVPAIGDALIHDDRRVEPEEGAPRSWAAIMGVDLPEAGGVAAPAAIPLTPVQPAPPPPAYPPGPLTYQHAPADAPYPPPAGPSRRCAVRACAAPLPVGHPDAECPACQSLRPDAARTPDPAAVAADLARWLDDGRLARVAWPVRAGGPPSPRPTSPPGSPPGSPRRPPPRPPPPPSRPAR